MHLQLLCIGMAEDEYRRQKNEQNGKKRHKKREKKAIALVGLGRITGNFPLLPALGAVFMAHPWSETGVCDGP